MWKLILIFGFILGARGENGKLTGPNVCSKYEQVSQSMTILEVNPRLTEGTKWCMAKPAANCSTHSLELIQTNRTWVENKMDLVYECCMGYKRQGSSCIAFCSEGCVQGECVAPEVCKCEKGFRGAACNLVDKMDCPCQNNGSCDAFSGACSCLDGYTGRLCEVQCAGGFYGRECKSKCRCKNGAQCEPTSGQCNCLAGFTGPLCEDRCLGDVCPPSVCPCQNGGSCMPGGAHCLCAAGYRGPICATPCSEGTWGPNCSRVCECLNGAACDPVSGECQCVPGFGGNDCSDPCPPGTWGKQCAHQCNCPDPSMLCSPTDGLCSCAPGFQGYQCKERTCSEGLYGEQCDRPCACNVTYAKSCHPLTGECECRAGWSGVTCAHQCPLLKWGEQCSRSCHCRNGALCDATDGRCVCTPGYTGSLCQTPCPSGSFGLGCSEKCLCSLNGTAHCSPVTGQCLCNPAWYGELCERHTTLSPSPSPWCEGVKGDCQCYPGFTGKQCSSPCPQGYYGENCKHKCLCENEAICRGTDGECQCHSGWMGTLCSRVCPPNKFGAHCMQECQCTKPNTVCHPVNGCVCHQGYTGTDCAVLKLPLQVSPPTSVTPLQPTDGNLWGSTTSNVLLCLILTLLIVGMIVFVVLYKRAVEQNVIKSDGSRQRPGPRSKTLNADIIEYWKHKPKIRADKDSPEDPEYVEITGNMYESVRKSDQSDYAAHEYDKVERETRGGKGYDVLNHNRCTQAAHEREPHYKTVVGHKPHRRPSRDKLPTPEPSP